MQVALVLYPKYTMLDIVGPFQVFADAPDVEIVWVSETLEPVVDHTGTSHLTPTHTYDQVRAPDVLVVPGGFADDVIPSLDAWIKQVHPTTTWTTSVCSGSIHLARAGLLDGQAATSHWAVAKELNELGAIYTEQRVVQVGKVITAAGVSAGIDMALTLLAKTHGSLVAQAVQLYIEYDPQPPFATGSPSKAPSQVLAASRSLLGSGRSKA
jgi:transcriptional regulator GlxA family with amidase domain